MTELSRLPVLRGRAKIPAEILLIKRFLGSAVLVLAAMAGLVSLTTLAACRAAAPVDEPGAFTFRGLPIHPAAIATLYRSPQGVVDLTAFPPDGHLEYRSWEDQPGWWIVEYEENLATGKTPFFAYAAFAGPDAGGVETYVVSVTFDDGRAGDVDNLLLLQKTGNALYLVGSWEEGSACRGGIFAQRIDGENFHYSRDLTPVDLLDLAPGVRLELVPLEDLEAMADSCYASANFVYHIPEAYEELVSVRLYDEPMPDEKGRTENYRYQSCFNRLFNAYLTEGRTVLTPADLDEFAGRFRDECLPAGSPAPGAVSVSRQSH